MPKSTSSKRRLSGQTGSAIPDASLTADALIWTNKSGEIVSCSKEVERLLGFTKNELKGKGLEFLFLDKAPMAREAAHHIRTKSGQPLVVRASLSIVRDGRKNPTGFVIRIEVPQMPQQTEALYQVMADSSPTGIFIMQNGRFCFVNRQLQEDTGYTEQELLTMDPSAMVHEADIHHARQQIAAQLSSGNSATFEFRIIAKDGKTKWLCGKTTPIAYGGGLAYLGNYIDITDRKEMEAKLCQSEEYFRALMENAPGVIVVVNSNGTVRYQSSTVESVLDYQPHELVGQSIFDFVHPDDLPGARELFEHGVEVPGFVATLVLRVKHRDGSWRHIELTGTNLLDNPAIKGIVMSYRDITDNVIAEQALRESEHRFRAIFESANDGIVYLSPEGRVLDANRRAWEIFGRTPDQVVGKHFADVGFVSPDDMPVLARRFEKALQNGDPSKVFQFQAIRGNGQVVAVETNASLVETDNGEIEGMLVIVRDVTERKRAEEALRESEEKFRAIFENASDEIIYLDKFGNILDRNVKGENIIGYTIDEVLGRNISELGFSIPGGRMDKMAKMFSEAMQGRGGQGSTELELIHKKGYPVYADISVSPIRKDGQIEGLLVSLRDVTERKQAQAEIKRREQEYSSLVELSPDGIVVLRDTEIVFMNRRAEEIFNRPASECVGRSFAELMRAHRPEVLSASESQALIDGFTEFIRENRMTLTHCLPIKNGLGETIWIEVNGNPIEYKGEKMRLNFIRDVTERIQAEETMRQQAHDLGERLKELHCLYGISKLSETPDISLEELIQATVNLIPYAWEYPEITCARVMLDSEVFQTTDFEETPWKQSSDISVYGNRIGVLEVCYLEERPERDEGPFVREERELLDALTELLGRFIEHKRAEEALRASEERYRLVAENITDLIAMMDQNGTYLYVNEAHRRIVGYEPDELIGRNVFDLIHPDDGDMIYNAYAEGRNTRQGHEIRYRAKDGSYRWLQVRGKVLKGSDQSESRILVVALDVTERKRAEEEQQRLLASLEEQNRIIVESHRELEEALDQLELANEELKRSQEQLLQARKLAAIGELASGIAHEVNNPLQAISGHTQLLLEEIEDEEQRESLEVIWSETKRATSIVQNLLSFARSQNADKMPVSLNNCIESTLKVISEQMNRNNIEVITELDPADPIVSADVAQLKQVFLNLINNAAYEMTEAHGGGTLTIRTRKVGDNLAKIEFIDDGPGIRMDIIDKIFEPFFTTKDIGRGTGLGLSICYGIISSHDGKIYADSFPGGGATFTVELPAEN